MSRKDSSKKLAKNIGFLSISQFSTKILVFFLVPLYTSVLSTAEYGVFDYFTTTIGLLIPIITLHIVESILRFSLDGMISPSFVLTNGLIIIVRGLAIFITLIIINRIVGFSSSINEYLPYFVGMFITEVLFQVLSYFARGIDCVLAISIAGVISTVSVIISNITFLIILKIGLEGYFLGTILGNISAVIFLCINLKVWHYLDWKSLNPKLRREMVVYSLPLILNQMSWWINNASDRYIVIAICGISANGIYSIGYKIPNILSTLQSIFNSSWTLSSIQDYDKNDSNGFFSATYEIYNTLMIVVCSAVILLIKITAKLLYANEFFEAWRYVPFLTIAVVFGAMSGYLGGIFTAVKDTKSISFTTLIGAIINICLNIVLVYIVGPIGAAIATMISCYAIFSVRYLVSKKYIYLNINRIRNNISYLILLIQALIMLYFQGAILYGLQLLLFGIILFAYRMEIKEIFNPIFKRIMKMVKEKR